MQEIWKDIEGYEGLYQVSNLGRIKSLQRITVGKKYGIHKLKEKILKEGKCGKYNIVILRKNGKNKTLYVHRLVAKTFINNSNNYPEINHKDGNTMNNNKENLEWCNRSYNIKHSYTVLKRKKSIQGLNEYVENHKRKVNQYDLNDNFIKTWGSISDAEKFLNITSIGKICECCQHKNGRKSAFGYKWEYVDKIPL